MMNRAALIDQIQEARNTFEKLLALLQPAPVERDRFVSHLSEGIPTNMRNCWEVRQANRAMCHLDVSDRREHWLSPDRRELGLQG
jgi:hypothetical protein